MQLKIFSQLLFLSICILPAHATELFSFKYHVDSSIQQEVYLETEGSASRENVALPGMLIGFQGDVIPLPSGNHKIIFYSDTEWNGFSVTGEMTVFLKVTDNSASVQQIKFAACNYRIANSIKHSVEKIREKQVYNLLEISPYSIVHDPNDYQHCADAGIVSPPEHLILSINSNVKSAEIYLNGEKIRQRTNTKISRPYNSGDTELYILLRKKNFSNCYENISLPTDSHSVSCNQLKIR